MIFIARNSVQGLELNIIDKYSCNQTIVFCHGGL